MTSQKYESGKLNFILNSLIKNNSSGILSLKTEVDSWQQQRSCILMLREGTLVYADTKVLEAQEFCRRLGKTLKLNSLDAALSVAVR